jgi:GDP-4-dehydro-6-deoxy-D-mannose reductase
MKALVTGAAGFIGRYLVEHLLAEGHEVEALARRPGAFQDSGPLRVHKGDVRDRDFLGRLVSEAKPEVIFHLAAQSLPLVSWDRPDETFEVNTGGTLNLFDALRAAHADPAIVVACSSAEYAPRPDGLPISEEWVLAPSSPYGVSKLAQDHLARLYAEAHGLRVVRARPFFLIGPRKERDVSSPCRELGRGPGFP